MEEEVCVPLYNAQLFVSQSAPAADRLSLRGFSQGQLRARAYVPVFPCRETPVCGRNNFGLAAASADRLQEQALLHPGGLMVELGIGLRHGCLDREPIDPSISISV